MAKIHSRNGFDYTHERFNFGGQWVVTWRLKPQNQEIWCPFNTSTGKANKTDLERLLSNASAATDYYETWLKKASDVDAARRRLDDAKSHYERVSDPNWGGSGSNPNSDFRILKSARSELESAEYYLKSAISLQARLSGK